MAAFLFWLHNSTPSMPSCRAKVIRPGPTTSHYQQLPTHQALSLLPAADAAAAQVAAQVSLLYNAPHFLVLRIGLLGGHPIQAHELVALEAGVQKVRPAARPQPQPSRMHDCSTYDVFLLTAYCRLWAGLRHRLTP